MNSLVKPSANNTFSAMRHIYPFYKGHRYLIDKDGDNVSLHRIKTSAIYPPKKTALLRAV
ncbi:hypothetical protein NMYAN_40178 [Nitrosomonas nitrosa]|uniref:Uncharacterized protein n=1 Tax=Nitrosomonas nitrosa TaxID=52442 RepID=A0A8H8Z3I4_9PROT|nr:hypothetical protein NMYAN_40178 [Nitrosomonas nitrosa]